MLVLIIVQEAGSATTTWLVIQIARDIAEEHITARDFVEIILVQTVSYIAGAVSWIFAERAGFAAYARYMLDFARRNRSRTALLADGQCHGGLALGEWQSASVIAGRDWLAGKPLRR